MGIKDIEEGSIIIVRTDGNDTVLGIVEKVKRSYTGVEIRACDEKNAHYTIDMYISD